jgi:hypothetical protein
VYQALTGDKLHKTETKDTTGFPRNPARVKRIGPRLSKVSDSTTLQVSLSMASGWDERQTLNGSVAFVVCGLAFLFNRLKVSGE